MKTDKTTAAAVARSMAEEGARRLFDQAMQTYVETVSAFEATGKALPLEHTERSPAQSALEKRMEDAMHTALEALTTAIELRIAQAVAAALAAL